MKSSVISRNVKVLKESVNPSKLVYATYLRTLKEAKLPKVAAKAVAEAFDLEYSEIVSIIREMVSSAAKVTKAIDENGKQTGGKPVAPGFVANSSELAQVRRAYPNNRSETKDKAAKAKKDD